MVKTPRRWTFGATSMIILEAYINAPNIAKTAISLIVSFLFFNCYFSTLKEYVSPAVTGVLSTPVEAYSPLI